MASSNANHFDISAIGQVVAQRLRVHRLRPRHYVTTLGLAKLVDAVTTIVGLSIVPSLIEANPVLRFLIEQIGLVPAVLVGSVVVVGLMWSTTELSALACQRLAPETLWATPIIRVIGYAPLTVVFFAAGVHNTLLIVRVTTAIA